MSHESSHVGSVKDADARRAFAVEVVERLRSRGFQAYWAGGCVRDLLMGHAPSDYDVATDARSEQVMALYRRTFNVGASFGVVRVLGDHAADEIEVATFRSDGVYSDSRRPDSVTYSTAEFDASRRDFTINGMFYDPIEQRVIDYVGGRDDLDRKILRAIGDPVARFTEDKLRLLRAVRFAARFGLEIEAGTRAAIEQMADRVTQVSPERIGQEWRKMLVHPTRVRALELVDETGLLAAMIPECLSLKQGDGAAWAETIRVLGALPEAPGFSLALAGLLRLVKAGDIAMSPDLHPPLPPLLKGGNVGLRAGNVRLIVKIAHDLKLANAERDLAAWLVGHDGALREAESMRRASLKKLLASPAIGDLLELHRSVARATTGDLGHVDYCERYLREQPDGPIDPPPLLTGHDLMKHGLKPGPRFAELLDQVRDAQLDGTIETKENAIQLVERLVAERPA